MAVKKESQLQENRDKKKNLFSKEQLLAAERFRDKRDMIEALFCPDKQYTLEEVERMIEKYMKGKVK